MSKQDRAWRQQRAREQLLCEFLMAYDHREYPTLEAILQIAERDAALDALIWRIFPQYVQAEQERGRQQETTDTTARVRSLLDQYLPTSHSPLPNAMTLPPITIADVAARMQADATARSMPVPDEQEIRRQLPVLLGIDEPLPVDVQTSAIRAMFRRLGIADSAGLITIFRETALFLRAGRDQTQAHLSAARRQQQERRPLVASSDEEQESS